MKAKLFTSLLALMALVLATNGQAPQGINYQAVARNAAGTPLTNHHVGLQFSVYVGAPTGTAVYVESDTATTNEFGLFTTVIGGGTATTGTFVNINWGSGGNVYLNVGIDPTGGTSYTSMGTTQLQSVPYALNSSQWSSNGLDIVNNNSNGAVDVVSSDQDIMNLTGSATNTSPYIAFSNIGGRYRGYVGIWSDTAGFDVGTGGGNTTGNFNLVTQASPKMTITPTGLVGIGTTAPGAQLDVQGDISMGLSTGSAARLSLRNSTLSIGLTALSTGLVLGNGGNTTDPLIYFEESDNAIIPNYNNVTSLGNSSYKFTSLWATNGTIQTSDARLKTNIQNLNMGLKEVMALRPVSYDWLNPAQGDAGKIGFIAQEVEKIVPQAVVHEHVSDKQIEEIKAMHRVVPEVRDPYGMNYSEMIPVLTKAIQEQQALIEQQNAQIAKLQQQVNMLMEKGK